MSVRVGQLGIVSLLHAVHNKNTTARELAQTFSLTTSQKKTFVVEFEVPVPLIHFCIYLFTKITFHFIYNS